MYSIRLNEKEEEFVGRNAEKMKMGRSEYMKWLVCSVSMEVDLRVVVSNKEESSVGSQLKRYDVKTIELKQSGGIKVETDEFGISQFLEKKRRAVVPDKAPKKEKTSVESPKIVEGFTIFPEEEITRKKFYELTGLRDGEQLTGKYQLGWGQFSAFGKFDESLRKPK